MHRVMKAQAVQQLAMAAPDMFNKQAVLSYVLEMLDVDNPTELMAVPQAATGPSPEAMIKMKEIDVKQQSNKINAIKVMSDSQNRAKDREAKQNIEVLKLASSLAVHPTSDGIVDEQIKQLSPLMSLKPPQQPGAPPGMPPQRPPMAVPMGLGGLGRPPMSFAPPPMRRPPMQPQGFR
jgi:hypothetical protein